MEMLPLKICGNVNITWLCAVVVLVSSVTVTVSEVPGSRREHFKREQRSAPRKKN